MSSDWRVIIKSRVGCNDDPFILGVIHVIVLASY